MPGEKDRAVTHSDNRHHMTEKVFKSHAINAHWQRVGFVRLAEKGYQLRMPQPLPTDPGIYRIEAVDAGEIYVGEGANLFRRLGNYENAGWTPGTFSRTNRLIQGWIYEKLSSCSSTFEILICTDAEFSSDGVDLISLSLNQKYFRTLIEAATIANKHGAMRIMNKQFDNEL